MAASFNQQFDQHGAWRREFSLRLKLLGDWMKDHELLDAALQDRLQRLETQVRADKVMVAFVAEFSRGKSELINAMFFSAVADRNATSTPSLDGMAFGAGKVEPHRPGRHQR